MYFAPLNFGGVFIGVDFNRVLIDIIRSRIPSV
jgi:hypothetical protein